MTTLRQIDGAVVESEFRAFVREAASGAAAWKDWLPAGAMYRCLARAEENYLRRPCERDFERKVELCSSYVNFDRLREILGEECRALHEQTCATQSAPEPRTRSSSGAEI